MMKKIKFAIPSYKRAEKQRTLNMLVNLGYEKEDIVIATQTKQDYEEYSERYGEQCTIIFREANTVTGNRNTLLDYFDKGQWLIMLDDDIEGIYRLAGKKLVKVETKKELDEMFTDFFEYTEKNNGKMWGVYPVKNAYFMNNTINKKNIINSCLGIINDFRFDENYKAKEDIELCCRYIANGYNVIRFNFITYDVKHKQKGGCYETWKTDENEKVAVRLVTKYPKLLKMNTKRKGEVLYCGDRH